jgi:hypothetical protein
MPCSPDPTCEGLQNADQTYTLLPNTDPSQNAGYWHYANMGWVGYVIMRSAKLQDTAGTIIRCTSANINLSQDITMPDVIDGRIDRTVYQMGPKIVEGTVSLPVVADVNPNDTTAGCATKQDLLGGTAGSVLKSIWCWTVARGNHGRLLFDDMNFDIRYSNHAAFTFGRAICNTLSMKCEQSGPITFDLNVIGRTRSDNTAINGAGGNLPLISDFLAPARVLTWNDLTVTGIVGCSSPGFPAASPLFYSNQVQSFNLEINNNANRFYGMNGSLYPIDVNVGKREVTGSLVLMGLQDKLRKLSQTNQDRFTEKNEIHFGIFIGDDMANSDGISFGSRDYNPGAGTWGTGGNTRTPIFARALTGVVFKIEEMSMTNELFTTTVNFLALANDQTNYEAMITTDGGNEYPTSCAFPAWS